MLRVVVDVNVYVSAHLSPEGPAFQVLKAIDAKVIRLVASPDLVTEIDEVLHRQKFHALIEKHRADKTVIDIRRTAEMHYPDEYPTPITRDADDDYLVHLARTAKVDYLISGDRDLLEAGVDDVSVIAPGVFVREILR